MEEMTVSVLRRISEQHNTVSAITRCLNVGITFLMPVVNDDLLVCCTYKSMKDIQVNYGP